jgi:ketosteroid isomerase-like protein
MSRGNVETLRSAYVALNAGDVDAALRFGADDLVIHRAGPDPPVRGKDAVKAFVAPEAFSEQTFEPLEFRENGDFVFVWLMVRAKGAGSGIAMDQQAAHVWEFREELAISLTVSFDRDEALEAAGLSK